MKTKGKYLKRKPKKINWFAICFTIYLLILIAVLGSALQLLWNRMDVYERSRPHKAMDALMASTTAEGWHDILAGHGISDHYIDTLDLNNAVYYKDINRYTDAVPAYGIRFGDTRMLYVTLQPGEALDFDSFAWEVQSTEPVKSGLCIYAPADAVITVDGQPIGAEYMTQENAQPLSVGPYEEGRTDIPSLAKYELDHVFDNSGVAVTDAEGRPLELSHETGKSSYYAPLMEDYSITAPTGVTIYVNGIALSESDAVEVEPNSDFSGIEDSVSAVPGTLRYELTGLVLRPEITAEAAGGTALTAAEDENSFLFTREHDEALAAEQEAYILETFDAYIAFSGNRGDRLMTNYSHYLSYLVPGSEAAERAVSALESLSWISGRDKSLVSCALGEVIAYTDDMFTAQIDFTMKADETENANSYLFVFVRYEDSWKVVRILNKTSFLAG